MGCYDLTRNALTGSLLAAAVAACHATTRPAVSPATRYLVTETPINVGMAPSLCLAVNFLDSEGVWWWEPGATGCTQSIYRSWSLSSGLAERCQDNARYSRLPFGFASGRTRSSAHSSTSIWSWKARPCE